MAEVAETGHHHSHTVVAAIFHRVGVADRSTGLDYRCDTGFVCYFDTVGKGEECIRCHSRAIEVEAEMTGFVNCLFEGINARGLAYARCQQLTVAGKDDGVAL